jgi:hypothetical protein
LGGDPVRSSGYLHHAGSLRLSRRARPDLSRIRAPIDAGGEGLTGMRLNFARIRAPKDATGTFSCRGRGLLNSRGGPSCRGRGLLNSRGGPSCRGRGLLNSRGGPSCRGRGLELAGPSPSNSRTPCLRRVVDLASRNVVDDADGLPEMPQRTPPSRAPARPQKKIIRLFNDLRDETKKSSVPTS